MTVGDELPGDGPADLAGPGDGDAHQTLLPVLEDPLDPLARVLREQGMDEVAVLEHGVGVGDQCLRRRG